MTPFVNRLQFSSPTCGAAAAFLLSKRFAKQSGLDARIPIRGQAMTTDFTSVFSEREPVKAVGYDLTRAAADLAYWGSGAGPDDLDLYEAYDTRVAATCSPSASMNGKK